MRNIILICGLLIMTISCDEVFNPEDPAPSSPSPYSDTEGNIVVINNSGLKLVLYDGGSPVRIVPITSEEFLVKIPNPNNITKDLWLYKDTDVSSDYDNPDPESIFRRWNVNLSSDYEIEHRVTWVVYAASVERESGTLMLSYNPGTENDVDVFLTSFEGSRIASLMSGQTNTNVGIDYGIYELYYKYWKSDNTTPDGIEVIGEKTPEDTPNMTFVLNDAFQETYRLVPHFDFVVPDTNGEILIQNNTESILLINANGTVIENIMIYDGPTSAMSYLPPYSHYLYILPAGNYNFSAINTSTDVSVADSVINIEVGESYEWFISGE